MLQQDQPEDFVVATGETHSVKEFCELAFARIGMKILWKGSGISEVMCVRALCACACVCVRVAGVRPCRHEGPPSCEYSVAKENRRTAYGRTDDGRARGVEGGEK